MHVGLGGPQKTLEIHEAAGTHMHVSRFCSAKIEIERRTEENSTTAVQIVPGECGNIFLHRIYFPLSLARDVPFLVNGGIMERVRGQQLLEVERAGDDINDDDQHGMHFHRGSPRFPAR